MKLRKFNNVMLFVETTFFAACAVLFALLGLMGDLSLNVANVVYIAFILLSFGYLFVLEFAFVKYDVAVHFKAYEKHYVPTGKERKEGYNRKGLAFVILLWVAYLAFIACIKILGFLSWYVFLIGACIIFGFNSFFVRKTCLLSVLFLHNKNNCCKNCGINGWDYAIFASALTLAPQLSDVATVINWAIFALSVVMLIIWEVNYHKHPYRFYPETNKALSCANCLKHCKYKKTS